MILTPSITLVLTILALAIFLFVSEIIRIDVAAVLIMVLLGVSASLPFFGDLLEIEDLFSGFSSNAVMSIVAVMILGAGLDRTGAMAVVVRFILRYGGRTENRIMVMVSGTVALISSFLQNVGAAALFIPVVSRVAARTNVSVSRLLMPMGFCAILGGTLTMVGSSPLILLNDLLKTANRALPAESQIPMLTLFSVTPVGLCLVISGLVYFLLIGRKLLPKGNTQQGIAGRSASSYYKRVYGVDSDLFEIIVPSDSPLKGQSLFDIHTDNLINIVSTHYRGKTHQSPTRDVTIETPCILATIGSADAVQEFAEKYGLQIRELQTFAETLAPTRAGICEVVVPPDSSVIGKTSKELWLRKSYGLSVMAMYRQGKTIHYHEGMHEMPFMAGDTLVAHCPWEALSRLDKQPEFVVITTEYPHEELRPRKLFWAVLFFIIALSLVMFTNLQLSLCLMVGAIGMIVSGVLNMDEAYQAVSWKTIFLLASLIPLGQAVQSSGTANWITSHVLNIVGDVSPIVLQIIVAILATIFTLVMSNVGATVLLVPLAINMAIATGADPLMFALTVAIATSNSFLIPTHQVNALTMGPGGYKVIDFVKAGGLMTLIFLVVSITALQLFFS